MDSKNPYLVPVAILFAGLVLAVTVYTVRIGQTPNVLPEGDVTLVRPIGMDDRILGNPDADVMLVEYSDIDCEYCKQFQSVLAQLVTEYGPEGNVAWTYRHFPVVAAHPDAGTHAEAAECAADIGGAQFFWRFIDAMNADAPGSGQFIPSQYAALATSLGIDAAALTECIQNDRFARKVALDFENALAIGAEGAPFTLILIKGAAPVSVSGFLPYEDMKRVVEEALKKVVAD